MSSQHSGCIANNIHFVMAKIGYKDIGSKIKWLKDKQFLNNTQNSFTYEQLELH